MLAVVLLTMLFAPWQIESDISKWIKYQPVFFPPSFDAAVALNVRVRLCASAILLTWLGIGIIYTALFWILKDKNNE